MKFCFTLFLTLAFQQSQSLEIRRISDPVPAGRSARRVKVAGKNADCFAYEGDVEYMYNGTDTPAFGKGYKHIWRTCGVFDDDEDKVHTLMSYPGTENGEDDDFPTISDDGSKICHHTKDIGDSMISLVNTGAPDISYIGRGLTPGRKSTYCDISPDGGTVVFQSNSELVPNVTVASNRYQVYATSDRGASYRLVAGNDVAEEGAVNLISSYPQVSQDGEYITFLTKMADPKNPSGATLKTNELFLSRSSDEDYVMLTEFNDNYCDLSLVFEKMKEYWGETNLTAEGISSATSSTCNLAAMLGWFAPSYGANLLGAGHGPARISNNGRFIAYTAGFDHANVRGTHENPQVLTADNLFLYDTVLGLISQISKEGDAESPLEFETRVEEFCCPSASSSKQRGTCSKKNEYKGLCCWQRPCWFPAQWPDISGDGSSISFFTAFPHNGNPEVASDYEVYHFHIPTGKMTMVTNTTHKDFDDTYPSISHTGEVIAFESDYDHTTDEDIVSANQVFAAKLSYGCDDPNAVNFHPNPDVPVNCVYPKSSEVLRKTSRSVKINFGIDINDMVSKVPFFSTDHMKKLCNVFSKDVLSGIAFALRIDTKFLSLNKKKFMAKCMRKGGLGMDITFLKDSNDTVNPKKLAKKLKRQINYASSDLMKGYLTKTINSIV